ncbi:MAG TPA: hypothetical protein VM933_01095 [Acidimicrobiales bacterium]|nr:hypothetical protein [Acidimicrobiales bacterium]
MLGAVIIVVVVVVALPVAFLMTGGVLSAVFGWVAKTHAEDTHPGSELTDLNY